MMSEIEATLRRSTREALARVVDAEAGRYDRRHVLPRLLPVGPDLIDDTSRAARLRILKLLARALRGERNRGRAGHWTYSLDRHLGLIKAYRAERAGLADGAPGTAEPPTRGRRSVSVVDAADVSGASPAEADFGPGTDGPASGRRGPQEHR